MTKPHNKINMELQEYKKDGLLDIGKISDGYHTFDELYDHRNMLYLLFAGFWAARKSIKVWRFKESEEWFLLGIGYQIDGDYQISYHLPMKLWDKADFADTLEQSPPYDGYTSEDVLNRLSNFADLFLT